VEYERFYFMLKAAGADLGVETPYSKALRLVVSPSFESRQVIRRRSCGRLRQRHAQSSSTFYLSVNGGADFVQDDANSDEGAVSSRPFLKFLPRIDPTFPAAPDLSGCEYLACGVTDMRKGMNISPP
jgi:hypothetical protein